MSPNPISNQIFHLQLDEPLTAVIKFYTIEGRTVLFSDAGCLYLKTDQKLSTGVYILTVEERTQTRQYRLIVE